MDFGALPPEINSARIYTGAGAQPMMAAAAAYNSLGAELTDTASTYESVTTALTSEEWLGPASTAMNNAITPHIAWMHSTAAALEHAAAQATASAAAYEAAFAMTVPPPQIAANRAQLAALVATNFLGQNTAAIAATETLYGEMWAQDAAAMFGYAASSANAAALNPLAPPTTTVDPSRSAASAASDTSSGTQNGLSQLIDDLPGTLQGLTSPLSGSGDGGFLSSAINSTQNIGPWNAVQTGAQTVTNVAAWQMFAAISSGIGLSKSGLHAISAGGGPALAGTTAPAGAAGAAPAAGAAAPAAGGGAGVGKSPVLASAGRAAAVGELSVPASWSAATPAETASTASAGTGWAAAAEEEGAAMGAAPAGMPAMATANRGSFGVGTPRYGFKPKVMARPLSAG